MKMQMQNISKLKSRKVILYVTQNISIFNQSQIYIQTRLQLVKIIYK